MEVNKIIIIIIIIIIILNIFSVKTPPCITLKGPIPSQKKLR